MSEQKVHWITTIRSNDRLWWTSCGLRSSSIKEPYQMTFKKSEVTCKNCLKEPELDLGWGDTDDRD